MSTTTEATKTAPGIMEADIRDSLNRHPNLTIHGYGWGDGLSRNDLGLSRRDHRLREFQLARARILQITYEDRVAVDACVNHLLRLPWNKRVYADSPTTYGLKHELERETGLYVANGHYIAAVLFMRLPVELEYNPRVAIGKRRG